MAKRIESEGAYTYRGGIKIELKKRPDEFVVRELPDRLPESMSHAERVSASSTRVRVAPGELEARMNEARALAPTHHAYDRADTGSEFLITDRIIVTFRQAPSVEDLGKFLGKYALQVVQKYSDREFLLRLTDQTGQNPVKLVVQLSEHESAIVQSVDHDLNVVASTRSVTLPTDPAYARQWHLHQRQVAAIDCGIL